MKKLILLALLFAGSLMQAVKDMPGYTPSWIPPEIKEAEEILLEAEKLAKKRKMLDELKTNKAELKESLVNYFPNIKKANDSIKNLKQLMAKCHEPLHPRERYISNSRRTDACREFNEQMYKNVPQNDPSETNSPSLRTQMLEYIKQINAIRDSLPTYIFNRYGVEAVRFIIEELTKRADKLRVESATKRLRSANKASRFMLDALTNCMASEESEESCLNSSGLGYFSRRKILNDEKIKSLREERSKLRQELLALKSQEKGLAGALD